jgi:tetratricopeptide (TPR) repeat protein
VKTAGLKALLVFILAAPIYSLAIPRLSDIQEQRRAEHIGSLGGLPAGMVRALSFEFKGIAADFLMLEAMTFVGKKLLGGQELSPADCQHLYGLLQKITAIDERFLDPYVFAESMLVWHAGMIEEGNQLLLKATEHRPWDYRPFYYLGFNYFYFLKDAQKAAPFLRRAAQLPGAPTYLKGLAARFSLYGNETAAAIIFLDEMLRETSDPGTRNYLAKRLEALEIIHELEKKVQEFKEAKGRLPQAFEEMIAAGSLEEIPADPYGGKFVLLQNGRVYTTSQLTEKKAKK